jgi:hypothetical protein
MGIDKSPQSPIASFVIIVIPKTVIDSDFPWYKNHTSWNGASSALART